MSPEVTAAFIAAGVGVLTVATTVVTQYLGRRATSKQLDKTLADQRTRTLNERFATAADQLGSDKPAIRLAGVYAMAGLADDWEKNRPTCIEVLCAYLRMPYEPDPGEEAPKPARLAFRASREVRHTVIRVITAHLKEDAKVSWQKLNFDFTGVVFDGGEFADAQFSGGTVDFTSAQFSGGTVTFRSARFSGGTVDFTSAQFSSGAVAFNGARFSGGRVTFNGAHFSGGTVTFFGVDFSGSSFVAFANAQFSSGTVAFNGARFSGAAVTFRSARFSGGTVDFTSAQFSGAAVTFFGARFSGGTVDLTSARFSGGTVDFSNVGDWSVPPTFPWTDTPPIGPWTDTPPIGVKLPRKKDQSPP